MKCADIVKVLDQYADGQLDTEIEILIKNHLEKCPECSKELDFIIKIQKKFSEMKKVKAPEDFLYQFNKRLNNETSASKNIFTHFNIKRWMPYEAAGAIIIAVVIVMIYKPFDYLKNEYTEKPLHMAESVKKIQPLKKSENLTKPVKSIRKKYAIKEAVKLKKESVVLPAVKKKIITIQILNLYAVNDIPAESESISYQKTASKALSSKKSFGAAPSADMSIRDEEKPLTAFRKKRAKQVSVKKTDNQIKTIIQSNGGLIIRESVSKDGSEIIEIEIHQEKYDSLIKALNKKAEIKKRDMPSSAEGKMIRIRMNIKR